MMSYRSDYLFSYEVSVAPPEVIGPCPGDIRLNFGLTGGEVHGPRLQGKVRPGGADFASLRGHGVILVDVRGLLESHDGALIDIAYQGVLDLGPDGYANFLKGVMPAELKIRAAPRLRNPPTSGSTACSATPSARPTWRGRKPATTSTPWSEPAVGSTA